MSRWLKLFMLAAVAAMTLVLAAFAWTHWAAISHLAGLDGVRKRRLIGVLVGAAFCPLWVGLGGFVVARQLAQRDLQLAARHHRFYETSVALAVLFLAVIQAWLAFGAAYPPFSDLSFILRATLAASGVFTIVYGNFNAKAAPASGALAPPPSAWIQGMLRIGWAMVLLGLAEVLAAIALPMRLLPVAVVAMLLPTLLITRSQWRLMWPSRRPSASA